MTRVPLAGVVGSPVETSPAPRLFAHWLHKHGLPGHYIPMEVAPDVLEPCLRRLPDLGFSGVNIAAPYKVKLLEIADLVSDRATLIGSANVLIFREDGKLHADNTEGYGFVQSLRQAAPEWSGGSGAAVVFGAGAAARAVIASLIDIGAPEIRLCNRSRLKADKLREEFGPRIRVFDWVQAGNIIEGCKTVVNATSLGTPGKPPFRVPLDALRRDMLVSDLVYRPVRTRLIEEAERRGCIAVEGLNMVLHQAVPGFERWFGIRPQVDEAARQAVMT